MPESLTLVCTTTPNFNQWLICASIGLGDVYIEEGYYGSTESKITFDLLLEFEGPRFHELLQSKFIGQNFVDSRLTERLLLSEFTDTSPSMMT